MSLALAAAAPRRLSPQAVAAAALAALAAILLARHGMMADVAWLVDCDERWLDGAVPYRDFLESNPPASLWLYLPAVVAARALHVSSEFAVGLFGFLLTGAALGLSAAVLRRVAYEPWLGPASVFALLLLPGQTFGERDHFAAILGFPFVALTLARAEGARPALAWALLAGAAGGVMAAVKPPFALIAALPGLYLLARRGWRATIANPEYYAAAAVTLAYFASAPRLHPEFVANIWPTLIDVYLPLRESLASLIASPGAIAALLIGLSAALNAASLRPAAATFGLAALGALIAYLVQGKGWVYQAVPASMFAAVAGAALVPPAPAMALAAAAAAAAVPAFGAFGLGWFAGIAAGFAGQAALTRDPRPTRERLAPLAFAAAVGAVWGLCQIEKPLTPGLEARLKALGPGLTFGAITEDEGLGFPMVRRLGGRWVMRSHGLWLTAAADRLAAKRPGDAALAERLRPYRERDLAELVEDITTQKPEALLVGPLRTQLHANVWADPRLQAALADYSLAKREERPGYSAELWLRRPR